MSIEKVFIVTIRALVYVALVIIGIGLVINFAFNYQASLIYNIGFLLFLNTPLIGLAMLIIYEVRRNIKEALYIVIVFIIAVINMFYMFLTEIR